MLRRRQPRSRLGQALLADTWAELAEGVYEWWRHVRLGRAVSRYFMKRGTYLAGGIAFMAMFSLFAALAIGWTIFMYLIGSNKIIHDQVLRTLREYLPGVINTGDGKGLLRPDDFVLSGSLSLAGTLALVVLLYVALRAMTALKVSLQAMFDIDALPENIVKTRIRDLAGFLILSIAILATSIVGFITSSAGTAILQLFGVEGRLAAFMIKLAVLSVSAMIDGTVIVVLIRVVAGIRVPRSDLMQGAVLGAVGSGALRWMGTSMITSVANPLLAGFTTIITLLLWVSFLAQFTLFTAAWVANPPPPPEVDDRAHAHAFDTPNYVTESAPESLDWTRQLFVDSDSEDGKDKVPHYWGGLVRPVLKWRARRLHRRLSHVQAELDRPAK